MTKYARCSFLLALCLLAALLLGARCTPDPVPPDPVVDAGPDPDLPDVGSDPVDDCRAAEQRLAPASSENPDGLGCRSADGAPLWIGPAGEPFADACVREYAKGYDFHASCLRTITRCDQADSAFQGFFCAGGDS